MATTEKYVRGTLTAVLSTGLNSLANNALVLSAAITFTETPYTLCEVELVCQFGTNPTANTGASIWFLREIDGANFEDGDASTTPARAPDVVMPYRVTTIAQRIVRLARLPPGDAKYLIKNDGSGQAWAASANTLKIRPFTRQAV